MLKKKKKNQHQNQTKPKPKARKPIKKIIEVYEDDEDDEEDEEEEEEEEEVIIKKVIKKKQPQTQPKASPQPRVKTDKSLPELYQLSNQEMLKRRLYQDAKRRVMMELFDC